MLQKYTHIFTLFLLVFAVLFTSSCKTAQKIQVKKQKDLKPIKLGKLYHSVVDSQLTYDEAQAKFSCDYKDHKKNSSISFSGTMRIKRDSIIWLTLSPAMGIEVVRVMLTPDSVAFLNRANSTYYTGNYDHINNMFQLDLDFYSLQGIMMNELFSYPYTKKANRNLKKFKSEISNEMYQFQSFTEKKIEKRLKKNTKKAEKKPEKNLKELIVQNIDIEPETFKIHKVLIIDYTTNRTMNVQYSDFGKLLHTTFPDKIDMTLSQLDEKTSISVDYSKITLEEDLKYPFKISSKYKRIE